MKGPAMPLHLDTERAALRSVIETAEFAADNLAAMRGDRKDSTAGKAMESENRLRALRGYLLSQFPELAADEAAPEILKTLPLGEFAGLAKVSTNSAYADYSMRIKVPSWADAVKLSDMLEPVKALGFSTSRYRSSVVPDARWPDGSKPARDVGERVQSVYSWVRVHAQGQRVLGAAELRMYVQADESSPIIDVAIEAESAPFYSTARRVNYPGGYRYESPSIVDPENALAKWPKRFQMWASAETVAEFTCL